MEAIMANKKQLLDKIERNMKQRGYAADVSRPDADTLLVDGVTVSYVDKSIQSPMGGVDDATSPFLGVGIAAPGSLKLADTGALLAAVISSEARIALLAECGGKANDLVIEGSDGEIRIAGQADVIGLGE